MRFFGFLSPRALKTRTKTSNNLDTKMTILIDKKIRKQMIVHARFL